MGVAVGSDGVGVGVGVDVGLAVAVGVEVDVGTGVGDTVGVAVGVSVGSEVGLLEGDPVGVPLEGFGVTDGVSSGWQWLWLPPNGLPLLQSVPCDGRGSGCVLRPSVVAALAKANTSAA